MVWTVNTAFESAKRVAVFTCSIIEKFVMDDASPPRLLPIYICAELFKAERVEMEFLCCTQ